MNGKYIHIRWKSINITYRVDIIILAKAVKWAII